MTEDNSSPRAGPRVMYVKRLTMSDACTSKQIKLPRSAAETFIAPMNDREGAQLDVIDEEERAWTFTCTRYNCQYALSKLGDFAQAHSIAPNDFMIFSFDQANRLCVACRKTLPSALRNGLMVELPSSLPAPSHTQTPRQSTSLHLQRSTPQYQDATPQPRLRDGIDEILQVAGGISEAQATTTGGALGRAPLRLLRENEQSERQYKKQYDAPGGRKRRQESSLDDAREVKREGPGRERGPIVDRQQQENRPPGFKHSAGDLQHLTLQQEPPQQWQGSPGYAPPRDQQQWLSSPLPGHSLPGYSHSHPLRQHVGSRRPDPPPTSRLGGGTRHTVPPSSSHRGDSLAQHWQQQQQQHLLQGPFNGGPHLLGLSPFPPLFQATATAEAASHSASYFAPPSSGPFFSGLVGPPPASAHQLRLSMIPAATGTPSASLLSVQPFHLGALSEPRLQGWQHHRQSTRDVVVLQQSPRDVTTLQLPDPATRQQQPHVTVRVITPPHKRRGSTDSDEGVAAAEALTLLASGAPPSYPPQDSVSRRVSALRGRALGPSATPGHLGPAATPGRLGTTATPGHLGPSDTPGHLGPAAIPDDLKSSSATQAHGGGGIDMGGIVPHGQRINLREALFSPPPGEEPVAFGGLNGNDGGESVATVQCSPTAAVQPHPTAAVQLSPNNSAAITSSGDLNQQRQAVMASLDILKGLPASSPRSLVPGGRQQQQQPECAQQQQQPDGGFLLRHLLTQMGAWQTSHQMPSRPASSSLGMDWVRAVAQRPFQQQQQLEGRHVGHLPQRPQPLQHLPPPSQHDEGQRPLPLHAPSVMSMLSVFGRDLTDEIILCKILTSQELQRGVVVLSVGLLVEKGVLPRVFPPQGIDPQGTTSEGTAPTGAAVGRSVMELMDERGTLWSCALKDQRETDVGIPVGGGAEGSSGRGAARGLCHLMGLSGFLSEQRAAAGDILRIGKGLGGQQILEGSWVYSVRLLRSADVARVAQTTDRRGSE